MGLLINLDNVANALEFSLISKDTRSSFYFIFMLLKLENTVVSKRYSYLSNSHFRMIWTMHVYSYIFRLWRQFSWNFFKNFFLQEVISGSLCPKGSWIFHNTLTMYYKCTSAFLYLFLNGRQGLRIEMLYLPCLCIQSSYYSICLVMSIIKDTVKLINERVS